MKLVTVATHSEGYFPWLLKSCERYGAHLDVLGWGEKWRGYAWRLTLMMKYLKEQNPTEVVCFIDGFDVILLKPPEELEARFLKLKERQDFKIAVGLEVSFLQIQQFASQLTFGKCQYDLISAGCYIGYSKDLLDVIDSIYQINPSFNADDQQMLLTYCRKEPAKVYIDKEKSMFLTLMYPLSDIKKHISPYLINDPCIYHGAANTNMNNLIRTLGYQMSDEEAAIVNAYHWRAQKRKAIYYLSLFIPYIVGILLVFVIAIVFIIYKQNLMNKMTNSN